MLGKQGQDRGLNWCFERRFRLLLLALGMLVLAYPLLQGALGTRLMLDALLTIVFLGAFFMIFSENRLRFLALVLAVPTIVGAWIDYVLPGLPRVPLQVGFHLVAAMLFTFTIATILRAIHKQATVSLDGVYGALCGYFLVGLAFGHLYCIMECLHPGSFQASDQLRTQLRVEDRYHFVLSYFSFVTLTSVGYGDITPASGPVRSLAVVEAIIGQFYIAVLIGELVGKRVSQAMLESPSQQRTLGGPFHPHVLEANQRARSQSAFGQSRPVPNHSEPGSS
jgi:hypothetical protein